MRRIPKLVSPDYVQKEFKIKDFSKYTQSCQGLMPSENGLNILEMGVAQTVLPLEGLSVRKIYYIREMFYAYLTDGNLVRYDGNAWTLITQSNVEPYIFPLKCVGILCTAILGETFCLVLDDGGVEEVHLTYTDSAAIYKEMLFLGVENRIYYSNFTNYIEFDYGLENAGYINFDNESGNVIALIPRKSALIVVCEKAVYNLVPIGEREDYVLTKQDVKLKGEKSSVQDGGEVIYLFSDNVFCKYKDGNLSMVECCLNGEYFFDGQSGMDGNAYYARVVDKAGNTYLFTYNGVTGESNLMQVDSVLVCDGGYFVEDSSIKRFTKNTVVAEHFNWQSMELDFDSPLIKSLVGIEVKTNLPIEMEIEYSYGKQTLRFESGLNLIKTHVIDKKFKIKLSFDNPSVNVEQIKFIYRLQEN